MPTYVAMLRGVNVGGRTKLPMADLRAALVDMGFEDVATYIQSGNVVFRASSSPATLPAAIEEGIEAAFGLAVAVVLRTSTQLAAVVGHNPLTTGGRDPAKLHVTFLASKPSAARVARVDTAAFLPDELRVVGREAY